MIKGFIFDLDGVLTDTAEYHYQAWKELAKELGIQIDRSFNEELKGISRLESLEKILIYGEVDQEFSVAEKTTFAEKKNDHYKQLIRNITPDDLLEGVVEFIRELEAAGMKLALASASRNAPFILKQLEIDNKFLHIVDPNDLKRGKPDPEIFLKGAESLHLSPQECIGIEDAQAGIESINDAGMFSVGVGSKTAMKEANYHVETTASLSLESILNEWKKQRS